MQHSLDLFLQILVLEPTRGDIWWKSGKQFGFLTD